MICPPWAGLIAAGSLRAQSRNLFFVPRPSSVVPPSYRPRVTKLPRNFTLSELVLPVPHELGHCRKLVRGAQRRISIPNRKSSIPTLCVNQACLGGFLCNLLRGFICLPVAVTAKSLVLNFKFWFYVFSFNFYSSSTSPHLSQAVEA